jgi:tRNA(fMet)-specific endonuclease VapC
MPLYLLDSSVCIPVLRGKADVRKPLPLAECCLSTIVEAELRTGARKSANPSAKLSQLDIFLAQLRIVDFDSKAADDYAVIRSTLETSGQSIGPVDLFIAAHAISLGATLLTQNFNEFRRVPGLAVKHWFSVKP